MSQLPKLPLANVTEKKTLEVFLMILKVTLQAVELLVLLLT